MILLGDPVKDYKLDMYLQNYQRVTGPALLCEKLMKEKRLKGITLNARRPELPRYLLQFLKNFISIILYYNFSIRIFYFT